MNSNLDTLVTAVEKAGKLVRTRTSNRRSDGSKYTDPSHSERRAKNRKAAKAAKTARKLNRKPKKRKKR